MDLLGDVLRTVRLTGAVLFRAEMSTPWCVRSERSDRLAKLMLPAAKRLVLFHSIAQGRCWAEVDGVRSDLEGGDVLVLPFGDEHILGCGEAPVLREIASLLPSPPPWTRPPRIVFGGGGTATRILCGFLHCDQAVFNPLLTALPRVIIARPGGQPHEALLRSSIDFLDAELATERPGAESVISRLTELLFVEVLRHHVRTLREGDVGWLAALRDERIQRALDAIHSDPRHGWTVNELAKRATMSRSAFAGRFAELLGDGPAQYLARWRLQRAAHLLVDSSDSLASIAARVGYDSDAAFSRAFKRHTGESPAAFRRARCVSG